VLDKSSVSDFRACKSETSFMPVRELLGVTQDIQMYLCSE